MTAIRETPAEADGAARAETALVRAVDMSVQYVTARSVLLNRPTRRLTAVDSLSLAIDAGSSYGLVGESGSGKSTAGRALLRLEPLAGGRVVFAGRDITAVKGEELRALRSRMQMVFQDPMGSLNPRQNVGSILMAPLKLHGIGADKAARVARVREVLDLVGLSASAASRYPHEFSGGQRQRVGIARAVIQRPEFLVADEPVSALDVSVQAQIINVLADVKAELGLTSLVIAHDLAVVRQISDVVGVMYLGALVEEAPADELYRRPAHPYTLALLSAAPIADPAVEDSRKRIVLRGDLPSPTERRVGCRFASRCPFKLAANQDQARRCESEAPALREIAPGHRVACHFSETILESPQAAA